MTTYSKKDFAAPDGPILLLSAKGLTTAGIAEANGVKDFSGNGNHGQAYGGVTVVNDSDLGECFSFDGTDDWLELANNLLLNNTEISINIAVKFTANNTARDYILIYGQFNQILIQTYNGNSNRLLFYSRGYSGDSLNGISFDYSLNTPYYISFNIDFKSGHSYVFINGVFIGETQNQTTNSYIYNTPNFRIGREHSGMSNGNYFFTGKIGDIHIYPRVLSAAEIKYLYNGFQPNLIMGQTIPSGAILDLSARGLTTAGIAQANGVVDRSGNGNHGQAYNGVAVVNDDEMGSCFSFDGSNDVIAISSNNLSSYFNDMEEMSLSLLLRVNAVNTSSQYLVSFKTQVSASTQSWICLWIDASTRRISFSGRWKESDVGNPWTGNEYFLTADLGTVYHVTVVCDFKNGVFKAYVNGVLVQTTDNLRTGNLRALYAGNNVFFGALNDTPQYGLNCSLADIRIYPRALTASEVQQLADASLKKIRGVNMGSNLIKHIYYGSNLIYAKIDNYEAVPSEVTYKIHQLMSTTQRNTIEYVGSNSDYASITYSNGTVNMGDWSDWINAHFTPVMLKSNGTVDYELNRDNLNYKSDGSTPSDIANTSYDGNAMLQIKKFYISVTSTTEDSHEVFNVSISDTKKDSSYTCYGFVDKDGNEQAFAYYSLFHCYIDSNNKLRSKAGITLSSYTTQSNYATMLAAARNNGSGWDISNYALENAIGLVLMMIYKDVNPMFVHQDSSNNYRESSTTPYNTTGALAASGGFPWTTTSTMPKALWLESYWRNAAIPGLASNTWVNGLGSLKNSNNIKGFGIYYKLTPPYTMSDPSLWTYMNNTIPYVYTSNSHQLEDVTVYENLLFPKSDAPDAIGPGTGLAAEHYTRYWGGGDVNGLGSSYHSATELRPVKTGMYRAMDKWAAPPHYLSYHAFGSASYQSHLQVGAGRLIYLKNSN